MTEKLHSAWDQVSLSPQADERIRAVLAAQPLPHKSLRHTTRIALIAAVIIGLLSVTALGVTRGRIVFREKEITIIGPDNTSSTYVEVGFDATTDEPSHLGVWTLDAPEDFEIEKVFYLNGNSETLWINADGSRINLSYVVADKPYDIGFTEKPLNKQEVTINGVPGYLYSFEDSFYFFWTNDENGIGFELWCNDSAIDLLALAKTVHPDQTYEKPHLNEDTLTAIAEFGDWNPTAMPGNYREYTSGGMPAEYGGESGHGYVWRTYVNDEGYTIELYYLVAHGDETYEPYVASWRELPGYSVKEVTVQGRSAGLIENDDGTPWRLTWLSEDDDLAFHLMAEGLTSEELLAVAESVALTS